MSLRLRRRRRSLRWRLEWSSPCLHWHVQIAIALRWALVGCLRESDCGRRNAPGRRSGRRLLWSTGLLLLLHICCCCIHASWCCCCCCIAACMALAALSMYLLSLLVRSRLHVWLRCEWLAGEKGAGRVWLVE